VAALAGVPAAVTARARAVLAELERGSKPVAAAGAVPAQAELPLYTPAPAPVLALLEGLDPDRLSPREALEFLYLLKKVHDDSP
jgi:DNA mismatch repair protein MutS